MSNERKSEQIVRENENINIAEKFTSASIIATQKNGLYLYRVFFLPTIMVGGWSIRRYYRVIISDAINFASLYHKNIVR